MILHLIMTPQHDALANALRLAQDNDRFLLLGDGVTTAHAHSVAHRGFFRHSDALARGLADNECWQSLSAISDDEWVALTLSAQQVISWS